MAVEIAWLPTVSSTRSLVSHGTPSRPRLTNAGSAVRVSAPTLPAQRDSAGEEMAPNSWAWADPVTSQAIKNTLNLCIVPSSAPSHQGCRARAPLAPYPHRSCVAAHEGKRPASRECRLLLLVLPPRTGHAALRWEGRPKLH